MSSDIIDLAQSKRMLKYCPSCGSKDIFLWSELLKCRKCYGVYAALEFEDELFK